MRVRAMVAGGFCVLATAGAAAYAVLPQGEGTHSSPPDVRAAIADWRWAPKDEPTFAAAPAEEQKAEKPKPASAPAKKKPKRQAKAEPEVDPIEAQASRDVEQLDDLASGAASGKDDVLVKAEVLKNGVALPPLEAPAEVRAIFEAGNTIARSPYKWGGGHGKWQDTGYDCSGSVSYALAAAGLLDAPQASGPLMKYGKPGKGKWITIYSNPGHVWMVVAGVRFDTVARGQTGSRWINDMADTSGYVARHPPGF